MFDVEYATSHQDWLVLHAIKAFQAITYEPALWGTVAQWAGSVLSGGSLILAFYIILRDRRSIEEAQARKLIVRTVQAYKKRDGYNQLLVIQNTAEQPFYDVGTTLWGFNLRFPNRWRQVPVGTRRRRQLAHIYRAIERGGRDTWHLDWESAGVTRDDASVSDTLSAKQTVTGKLVTVDDARAVVKVTDSMGRSWGYDVKSGLMFRWKDYLRD